MNQTLVSLPVSEASLLSLSVLRAYTELDTHAHTNQNAQDQLVQTLLFLASDTSHADLVRHQIASQHAFTLLADLARRFSDKQQLLEPVVAATARMAAMEQLVSYAIQDQTFVQVVVQRVLNCGWDNVTADAVLMLGNLAFNSKARSVIRECGGIKAVLMVMAARKDKIEVLDNCCYALANLSVSSTENMQMIIDLGGIPAVIDAMNRFGRGKCTELIESGTCLLTNLCAVGNHGRTKIAESGGIKLLAHVLVENIENLSIVTAVLRTLSNLALSPTNAPFLIRENATLTVCEAMMAHKRDEDVVELSCQVFGNVSSNCSANEMSAILKEGIVSSLVSVCRMHRESSRLKLAFLQCMANIAGRFPAILEPKATRSIVIPALIEICSDFHKVPKILRLALVLLSKLAASETNVECFVSNNGLEVLHNLLQENFKSKNESMCVLVLSCLCAMANKDSAEKIVALNILSLISDIISASLKDYKIVDLSVRTITRMSFCATVCIEISKVALRSVVSAVQFNLHAKDHDFIMMNSTLFVNLSSAKETLPFLKNLIPKVVINLLKTDRDPPLTSQCTAQLISVLVKLLTLDSSGVVLQRCAEVDAHIVVQNVKAQYQKNYHAQLENVIAEFSKVYSNSENLVQDNLRNQNVLSTNAELSAAVREASLISRRGSMLSNLEVKTHESSIDSDLKEDHGKLESIAEETPEVALPSAPVVEEATQVFESEMLADLKHPTSPRRRQSHRRINSSPGWFDRGVSQNNQNSNRETENNNLDDGSTLIHGDNNASLKSARRRSLKAIEAQKLGLISSAYELRDFPEEQQKSEIWRSILSFQSQIDKFSDIPKVVELVKLGIPKDMRTAIWSIMSGANSLRSKHVPNYYALLVDIFKKHGTPHDFEIRKDISRTLPHLALFQSQKGRDKLLNVLSAFCLRNPESIGYCQSMNYICGALLTEMEEEDAFWILCSMIENRLGYYSKSMCALLVDQSVLSDLIAYQFPQLYDHLQSNEISLSSICVSWFLCQFVEAPLPIDMTLQFWDYLFLFGDELLFQMALKIFEFAEKELLQRSCQSDILTFILRKVRDHLPNIRQILNSINVGSLVERIASLREYHRNRLILKKQNLRPPALVSSEYKLSFTEEEISRLWHDFMVSNPWHVLLHSTILNATWLQAAISPFVYPNSHLEWRDHGLISGLMERLFTVLDTNSSGLVDFNEFLVGVHILCKASDEERLNLAFRFCDMNEDRIVDRNDLLKVTQMIEETYNGKPKAHSNALAFTELVFDAHKELSPGKKGLQMEDFRHYALMHPLICKLFKLDPSLTSSSLNEN